ncbi:MAG: hydantoin racemase [Spirochaetota bacterium]|nr:MAG: hydantoin racemase [Spirochaetota bacterium]
MKILWINPVGTAAFDEYIGDILKEGSRSGTKVDVVSLAEDRPKHLESHSYEAMVVADIVNITYQNNKKYDAIVIGCYYDVGLREAREVSGKAIVTAPCQSSLVYASFLGNSFSVLVGRRKWISKMEENVIGYGYGRGLCSMRPLGLGVHDFQADRDKTQARLLDEGRKAVEEDGAEVLILGCTIEYGFHETMQDKIGVPVIDAVIAPFKLAELMAETAEKFGWYPSRKWGSEPPSQKEIDEWGLFKEKESTYNYLTD